MVKDKFFSITKNIENTFANQKLFFANYTKMYNI